MNGSVLIVEDEDLVREVLEAQLTGEGLRVRAVDDIGPAFEALREDGPDLVLTDLRLPSGDGFELIRSLAETPDSPPVVVLTAFGSIDSAVEAVKLGAYDYLTKPYDEERLLITVRRALEQRRLREDCRALRSELLEQQPVSDLSSRAAAMRDVLRMAAEVAANPHTTVLLLGESGTGKEVLARAIHNQSARRDERFVALHCAAVPETLLESTLFGHEKGVFTGATQSRRGKFEAANGGTIFLDEIGEMPASAQVKLLRVLQDRRVERLGSSDPIELDVRVIAATNRNLNAEVETGRFREDLFYRLNVFPLELPPLRDRREDIADLAALFLERHAAAMGKTIRGFDPAASAALERHDWPGNIRELENVIERAAILCREERIGSEHLPFGASAGAVTTARTPGSGESVTLEEMERRMIEQALAATGGNQSAAASRLGISRWQLRTKLGRYGLGKG